MADLAIGVSKTALDALVNKVKTAIKEDEKWQTVQRDMVFIKEEFERMQSFLDATSAECIKNNVVKTWVRQVRDLSYDSEDCIEFVVHLDTKQLWWLRLRRSCMATGAALPLDQAVMEIKLLKAWVEDLSHRTMRYNLISDSGSKPVVAEMEQKLSANSKALDIFVKAREADKDLVAFSQLKISIATADKNLRVISVCGTGGDLGTASITRKVYEDSEICSEFKCLAWVKFVLPFNSHEFIRNLVDQLYTNFYHKPLVEMSGAEVVARMHATSDTAPKVVDEVINTQRYLIILEDLSSMAQWDPVRAYLPDMKNGSRIIVSTHQLEIASMCVGQPYEVPEIRQLSANHSVCLFFKEIKPDNNVDLPGTEDEIWHDLEEEKLPDSAIIDNVLNLFKEKLEIQPDNYNVDLPGTKDEIGPDLEADELLDSPIINDALYPLKEKGIEDGNESSRHGNSPLLETASQWLKNIHLRGRDSEAEGLAQKITFACSSATSHVVSVWGNSDFAKLAVVRTVFYRCIVNGMFEKYAWVEAPEDVHPVGLWSLFLQRCLGQTKTYDVEKGLDLLRRHSWLIVIDRMEPKHDWDFVKTKLSLETRNCIILITGEESFGRYCATKHNEVCHIKDLDSYAAHDSDIREDNRSSMSSGHPSKLQTAYCWLKNVCLLGRDSETNRLQQKINSVASTNIHQVLSVWGTAGVGKSVLVGTVFFSVAWSRACLKSMLGSMPSLVSVTCMRAYVRSCAKIIIQNMVPPLQSGYVGLFCINIAVFLLLTAWRWILTGSL